MMIKAIIGLGNPGQNFHYTRHNIGFRVLDHLANLNDSSWKDEKNYKSSKIEINNNSIELIKPQTFMNNSGEVLKHLFYKGIKPENIMVVIDDLETQFGKVKTSITGSAKGHNGVKSIIEHMQTKDFPRIRVGISRPEDKSHVPEYVLSKFTPQEEAEIPDIINIASEKIKEFIEKKPN